MQLEHGIARLEMRPIGEPHLSDSPAEFDANEAVFAPVELDDAHEPAQQKIDPADQPTEYRLGKVRLWRHRGENSDKQPKTNHLRPRLISRTVAPTAQKRDHVLLLAP
jgi:hypothetical protein